MATATRNIRDLMKQADVAAPAIDLSKDQVAELVDSGEVFAVVTVEHKDTDEYGGVWEYYIRRSDGLRYFFSLWDNPRRDEFSTYLMQWCIDGPVEGIKLARAGKATSRMFYLTAA